MAREINRLTAADVTSAKPGKYPDGGGLWLDVSKSRTDPAKLNKSWTFRFELNGRDRWGPGLGSTALVTLAEARAKAKACRSLRDAGQDPIEARKAAKAVAVAKTVTFEWCAIQYMAAHEPAGATPSTAGSGPWRAGPHLDRPELGGFDHGGIEPSWLAG